MKQTLLKTWFQILTILYIIGIMIFIWAIDVSTGALWRGNHLNNGWQTFDPLQIYHIGIFGIIITTFLYICIVIYVFNKNSAVVEKT